MYSELR